MKELIIGVDVCRMCAAFMNLPMHGTFEQEAIQMLLMMYCFLKG